jgi:hypothetical protein
MKAMLVQTRRSAVRLCLAATVAALAVSCPRQDPAIALVADGYASWRPTTQVVLDYEIPGHMDSLRRIVMNETGFGFTEGPAGISFPEGTVIVKEILLAGSGDGYGAGPVYGVGGADGSRGRPNMITAMVKAKDDPRARGGWIWLMKDPESGKESVVGQDLCYRCHLNANEAYPYADGNPAGQFRDFVFFVPGKDEPAP